MIKTRLVRLLSHAKKYIVYNILWQWISLLTQIAVVLQIAELIRLCIDESLHRDECMRAVIVFTAAIIVRFVCDRMAVKASYLASVDVKRVLREKIYDKLLKLGTSYKEQIKTSEVVQLSTEGVEQLEIYFGRYLPQLFYSLLAPITLFAVLSFVNVKASVVLLCCVPLIPASIVAVQKFAKKLLSRYWGIYTGLGDSFLENLQGLTTLKIYQADENKAKEMDEESDRFRRITMKVLTMQLNSISVMDIVAYGGAAVGMIVAISELQKGNLDFAGALTIILLASEFFIPLRLLGSFFHIAMNGMAASDKIFRLLDLEEPKRGSQLILGDKVSIRMVDVSFSYEENRSILDKVSIDLPSGSFVSLVGRSGCGKSTIAGLLTGKNKEYSGRIQINGFEITDIPESGLMDNITLVCHNSYLFKGTIEENLRMAKQNATVEEMMQVLKQVNLLDFVETQQGLQTELMESGSNLSGGQCQRLALARALLHNTPVYLFDEATSNIDAESEELIMAVIHELAREKTVLLISHRLSNVTDSDCIYMLESGTVVEYGTHSELMNLHGSYQNLFDSQRSLEAYTEGKVVEA